LSLVRHIFEVSKEYRRLDKSCASRPDVIHRPILPPESEDVDRFSTRTICHLLLHPIALRMAPKPVAMTPSSSLI
jgi:hypothetical protein